MIKRVVEKLRHTCASHGVLCREYMRILWKPLVSNWKRNRFYMILYDFIWFYTMIWRQWYAFSSNNGKAIRSISEWTRGRLGPSDTCSHIHVKVKGSRSDSLRWRLDGYKSKSSLSRSALLNTIILYETGSTCSERTPGPHYLVRTV